MVRGFKGGCFFRWGKQAPPETRRGAPAFYSPSPGPKRGRPPPSRAPGGKHRKGRPRKAAAPQLPPEGGGGYPGATGLPKGAAVVTGGAIRGCDTPR